MKKNLADVCEYLKALIITHTPDDFVVAERFKHGLTDEEIRKGIAAFREFLYVLYDRIACDKDSIDAATGKKYNPESGEDSIQKCFPLINDIAVILSTLGQHGKLETEPKMMLTVNGGDLFTPLSSTKPPAMNKISGKRKLEVFNFLFDMGFYFEDINLQEAIDFSKTDTFYVTYENNDFLILGLKLLAEAKENIQSGYQKFTTTFMRGDFYPLANDTPKKHSATSSDFANSQPPEIRNWIVDLDKMLFENKCKISTFYLSNTNGSGSFAYTSRKGKTICRINMSILGSEIVIHSNHISSENTVLAELPEHMQDIIKNAGGCGGCKARNPDTFVQCRHGGAVVFTFNGKNYERCVFEGYSFSLDKKDERVLLKKLIEYELDV